MAYILSALSAYLVGSLPTAFLLLKWKMKIDIRQEGSGNVGTLNAMEVSKSNFLGVAVLVIDLLKGSFAVLSIMLLSNNRPELVIIAAVGVVIGHNYPAWLKFRGGRGLAPTAGVMFVLGPVFIAAWMVLWLLAYLPSRNVHVGNIAACVLGPLLLALLPEHMLASYLPGYVSKVEVLFVIIALCSLMLVRHSREIAELFHARQSS